MDITDVTGRAIIDIAITGTAIAAIAIDVRLWGSGLPYVRRVAAPPPNSLARS